MLGLVLLDKVPCKKIRETTGVTDAIEFILRMKWKWAGHIGRMTDNRWTTRCTFWKKGVPVGEVDKEKDGPMTL